MAKFSTQSLAHLAQAHPDLQRLFNAVILETDCTVLDAQRGRAAQETAFAQGHSHAHFGQSAHNYAPAVALDVVPHPLDWNDINAFIQLSKMVKSIAVDLGVSIDYGGDWKSLKDYPHYELSNWRQLVAQKKVVLLK